MEGMEKTELHNQTQPEEIETRPQPEDEAAASAPAASVEAAPVETSQGEAAPEMPDMESMSDLYEESLRRVQEGEVVKGRIVSITKDFVMVDIGYKSEGVISSIEFQDIKAVKVGDEIDVLIEKLENKEGTVVLSHEKAEFKKNWDKILTICNEGGRIVGKVKSIVKGGLVVNVGVEAFLPASQIDVITPRNLTEFVGNSYEFKVVKSTRTGRTSSSRAAN